MDPELDTIGRRCTGGVPWTTVPVGEREEVHWRGALDLRAGRDSGQGVGDCGGQISWGRHISHTSVHTGVHTSYLVSSIIRSVDVG